MNNRPNVFIGVTGKVTIGGEVAYISNWSVENSVELIEFAELGEKSRHKVAGMTSWTASADGTVYFGTDAKSHARLFTAMNNGTPVECDFYLDSISDVKFSGTGLIESLSVDLSAEDKGNISISISGCGQLTPPK